MSTIQSAEQLISLLDTITALHPADRAALALLAVMYAPVARTPFAQCLQNAGIKSMQGKTVTPAEAALLMDRYVGLNLVVDVKGSYCCNPQLSHILMRQVEKEGLLDRFAQAVQSVIVPRESWNGLYYRSYAHCVQDIRIALYRGNEAQVSSLLESCSANFAYEWGDQHPFALICPEPLDREWIMALPLPLRMLLIIFHLDRSLTLLQPTGSTFTLLEELINSRSEIPLDVLKYYLTQLLLRGQVTRAVRILTDNEALPLHELRGWLAVLQGDDDPAIAHFERGIAVLKKETGKRKVFFHDLSGLFYLLALIRSGLPQQLQAVVELGGWVVKQRKHPHQFVVWTLCRYAEVKLGKNRAKEDLEQLCTREQVLEPISQLFLSLIAHWLPGTVGTSHLKALQRISSGAAKSGYHWLAAEAALLQAAFDSQWTEQASSARQLFAAEGIISLCEQAESDDNWERSLKALMSLGNAAPAAAKENTSKATRIIWMLSGNETFIDIQPLEQKQSGKGWSTGRNAALKRLKEESARLDFLSPQDREIVACIRKVRSGYGYYGKEVYEFDVVRAIRAMTGHPLVFNALDHDEQISVAKGDFALEVKRVKGNLWVKLIPPITTESSAFFRWEGTGRLLLFEPTIDQRRIAGIIGDKLIVPQKGEAQVMAAITAVSPHVAINSDVAGENAAADVVEADGRLQILLRPNSGGLLLEIVLLPLGEGGPRFIPGRGGATVIADVKGRKLQTSRQLATEKQSFAQLVDACPALDQSEIRDGIWRFDDAESSLELLEELKAVVGGNAERFCINWPEGEQFKLRGRAEWPKMKLSVNSGKEWFSLSGEVAVSDDEVMSLQRLMELVDGESGRFIQLADGDFLVLTEEFRRKLQDLRRLVEKNGRFTPLIAPLVEETLQGAAGVKGDKQWKADMARYNSAQELDPTLPPTLQAELRDYQRDGFDWLCRLAQWGVGACLADDMGLGKTLQALALLLTRAAAGPALVLAPTSVCFNWESEARRFAPTLNPRLFGGGNRAEFIASLAPFDLVICSYTLFQQEADLLTGVEWETVVLDEAQAIKNMATKRSQAAMQLKAGFRLATSGTPVENRLDELWNLFRFLNPGLLGSHKSFTTRFAIQIEKHGSKAARTLLKRLIRPFILRRTKSQVLEELPPRTDILHRIELSREENVFYEALRRTAVKNLSAADNSPPGEKQIRILAEIMRLRRACCHPQLVMPGSTIPSAKLAAFHEIVAELREGGHRALVFSQFVDHLSILRRDLDNAGIAYQYLDGSTPQKDRQGRVAAFQSGEGELFLISLKAGGVGLNLTAADYVIHMDPWWNPAVEDQASDRAHRIGQNRPVTVYRLVAANTIEEKIVALHHQKRDLADSLLEGTETSARVSAEDLMALLRDVGE
ncbi:MAG: DEAD/DEAH box helicase [Desulfuromonadaceae bacterium]|nr:DEAD/DEAH box helicase [Desulfuromonadaceae bacterium]MDD2847195.1 DEAD/DEAH box helicase [Desulfuromonadaceae bacterium]MDD4130139.1 DEAD/DEAH box helicase [Desulfuromonadaceae bacterium]